MFADGGDGGRLDILYRGTMENFRLHADTANQKGWIIDMAPLNSYFGMGMNDYLYAKGSMATGREIGNFNGTAALCSQSGEKFFKAIIEKCFTEEDDSELISLLRTHNLRSLYNKITSKLELLILPFKDI